MPGFDFSSTYLGDAAPTAESRQSENRSSTGFSFAAYPPVPPRAPTPFGISAGGLRSRNTSSTGGFGSSSTTGNLVSVSSRPSTTGGGVDTDTPFGSGGFGSRPSTGFSFGGSLAPAPAPFGAPAPAPAPFGAPAPAPAFGSAPEPASISFTATDPPASSGRFGFGGFGSSPASASSASSSAGFAFGGGPPAFGTGPSPFGGFGSAPAPATGSGTAATSTDPTTNGGSNIDGPEEVLPPALPKDADDIEDETKQDMHAGVLKLSSVASDLTCPITLQLPWEPVIASDGRIYEKSAIEEYFKTQPQGFGGAVRSPVTNLPMGVQITSALQVRNVIETLVEAGTITGDLANNWKEKSNQKKKLEDLLKKAGGGNVDAMEKVAVGYNNGINGFQKDYKQAYKWFEKAHLAESVYGTAKVGEYLVGGYGVEKDMAKGMMFLGMAAGQGSDLAAYILGLFMADGRHGVPVDKAVARKFLEKCLSGTCVHKTIGSEHKGVARAKLDELTSQE